MKQGRVTGKKALVSGGVSGIGLASAKLLAAEGAEVIIADINPPEEETGLAFHHLDVSDENAWADTMAFVADTLGRLDIFVNSAGINGTGFGLPQNPEELSLEQFRKVMSVNGEGSFLGCKAAIAAMKGHGGAIVNIGSLSAHLTMPTMFDYAASKSVMHYLTRTAALHCADKGYDIRCNLVTPGATLTPLWGTIFDENADIEAQKAAIVEKIPLKRWTMPEDVAYAVLYLVSDEARCVTGAEILVDGGQRLGGRGSR